MQASKSPTDITSKFAIVDQCVPDFRTQLDLWDFNWKLGSLTLQMSSELTVKELRNALKKRGLDTTGLKSALVSRLDAALSNAGDSNKKSNGVAMDKKPVSRKRQRIADDSADGTSNPSKCLKVEDEADIKESDKEDNKESDKEDPKHNNERTVVKKGRAVLDEWLPPNLRESSHVLEVGNDVYDAMLNQTNLGHNNNKFYVIQALESDKSRQYHVFIRWGRVGVKGQHNVLGPFASRDMAISSFDQKFFDKTKNHWSERHNFVDHPGKYTWLEMDYEVEEKQKLEDNANGKSKLAEKPQKVSKLDMRVASLISLICNVETMKQRMIEIGYDAKKMPLGKLSKTTILKGYEVLKRIATALEEKSNRQHLEALSSEFYTVIPHDFGFKKIKEFIIDNSLKLKKKLEMVEALGEIEVAMKVLDAGEEEIDDPHYSHYKQLKCDIEPLESKSEEFTWITQYVNNTHGHTHSGYGLEVQHAFRIRREEEDDRFQKFSTSPNRMLLWHGSRLTNWTGILSQGLRIAPPEAPSTGYMFGKGVYFADMVSKSANYCYTSTRDPVGILILCEVALGEMQELSQANYNANQLPPGKLSTKGVGSTAPDPEGFKVLQDGVVVPMGKPKPQSKRDGSLQYNEYIVYDTSQIRMRYLLQVKFQYKYH